MTKKKETVQTTKLGNKTVNATPKKTDRKKAAEKTSPKGEETVGHKETIRFISGLVLLVVALFMLLSFTSSLMTGGNDMGLVESGEWSGYSNYAGALGARCAYYWMNGCFGFGAFFLPVLLIMAAMKLTRAYKVRFWRCFLNCTFLMFWFSVSGSFFLNKIFENQEGWEYINPGGQHGQFICERLENTLGVFITFALLVLTAIAYFAYLSSRTIQAIRKLLNPTDYLKGRFSRRKKEEEKDEEKTDTTTTQQTQEAELVEDAYQPKEEEPEQPTTIDFNLNNGEDIIEEESEDEPGMEEVVVDEETEDKTDNDNTEDPGLEIETPVEEEVADEDGKGALEPYDPKLDLEHYTYPVLQLLDKYADNGASIDMEEQNKNKDQIIEVLKNFGVGISSIKATVGPTITLYEITPAKGVRISKIRNLEDDIALSLSALGIRIIAPIPGKGTIGIEVPNARPQMVSMESILNSKKFQDTEFELPIALGKTITNEVFMVDLAKMPHLLVAGATGQGKSVGLNAIITSLLYKKHPAELKFVMVDPKKVEFSIYSPIENHFLAKVADSSGESIITDVNKVVQTLKSLCSEMDTRYDLLKKARARNIKEYNAKFKNRQLNPENGHKFMPYIVVIIDEFGDLIMTAGKEIELPIARIAQLARAVGIHMIIATQRPTTNIITGTIKANFPARMAFKVSAMIDSRTILDRPGANQLIGRGDMLFSTGADPVRVQCAFVDTPEVERITAYIARQQSYIGPFELPKVEMEGDEEGGAGNVDMQHLDPMFEEAARLIVATQQGSTSMIQRKFAIGYNRAGRLMDQLEKAGIVGAAQGSKPREVLCIDDTDLEMRLNNLR
ncbi:MAG: DNA translocase FtsK 4TM domain-containing protein [Paraprevotella sp.]|nr:DNA translocase FtsK 4TM domain-containing protein [Paraprevotella sp.]